MKYGVRLNLIATVVALLFLALFIFSKDCKGQNLDSTYKLINVTVVDVDKNNTGDILLLKFTNRGDYRINKILCYFAYDGTYLGRIELEGKNWIYYARDGTKEDLGTDNEKPKWLRET